MVLSVGRMVARDNLEQLRTSDSADYNLDVVGVLDRLLDGGQEGGKITGAHFLGSRAIEDKKSWVAAIHAAARNLDDRERGRDSHTEVFTRRKFAEARLRSALDDA